VPNFAEILKPITNMLKKYVVIKWSLEEKSSFQTIKKSLFEAPILANPGYTKDLFIFSFPSRKQLLLYCCRKMRKGTSSP
jgi:hypothetical protein